RVLFASDNIEVIEIGVPAEHVTTIDHGMTLPTPQLRPDREFGGQVFCRHECSSAHWAPWCLRGYEHRETGIAEATRGVAAVQIVRAAGAARSVFVHDAEILFCFVMEGGLTLETSGRAAETLLAGDAFVTPPGEPTTFSDVTTNLELLVVSLPGAPGIADAAVR
ncbi:MAG: cupin, partial [Pseudomonadota bacterium]